MATTVDDLIVRIRADTKSLQASLDQIEGKLKVTGKAGSAAFGAAGGGLASTLSKAKGPAIAFAAALAGIGVGVGAVARVGAGFEDLKDSLNTVFGSITQGDAAFDSILNFAQTTPFQVEDVTKAFIQLKGAGIEPNMEMLQTFADTASTSIDQLGAFEAMVRLVQRSAAGGLGLEEINMLDDRGIPATKILTEALGKSREELSEFGKTAEGAAQMVDALINGMQQRFGGAMEEKMDNLSTKASNMMIAFRDLADSIFKSGLGELLKGLADRLGQMANNAARFVRMASGTFGLQDIEIDTTQSAEDQLIALQNQIKELENTRKRGAAHPQKIQELGRMRVLELGLQERITAELEAQEKITEQGLVRATGKNVEFLTEFKKLLEDSVPEAQQLQEQLDAVADLKGKVDAEGNLLATDEEIERVTTFLNDLKSELESTTPFTDEMRQATINLSQTFTTDFVNALLSGQSALESFKNFSRNLVSQIIATFLQLAVVNQILNSVFGLTGSSALPTISALGGSSPAPKPPSGGFGMGMSFAGGGNLQANTPVLVGERGTELFIPNTGGRLMNHMNTKNAMGSGTTIINQSVNFSTGIVPTVKAEVTKLLPQIADVTKASVLEANLRGGSFAKAMGRG